MSRAGERLKRLLAIIAYVRARGRVPVDEVAAVFGIDRDRAIRDVELASLLGLPPYTPERLVELYYDEETDEAVAGPTGPFDRPPRLSVAEGFAVLAAGRALEAVPFADPDGALGRALAKLERVLGDARGLAVDVAVPEHLDAVRRAAQEGRRLEVTYYSAWRDATSVRRIEPHVVYEWGGRWYVDAYSPETGDVRHYRVDRIRALADTGERFEPVRAEPPVTPFDSPPDTRTVVIEAPAASARWVTESYECEAVETDGRVRITLKVAGLAWLERLLLRLGPAAKVLAPPELAGCGGAVAERVLARYAAEGMSRA